MQATLEAKATTLRDGKEGAREIGTFKTERGDTLQGNGDETEL
jgi:hypothetical protein